MKSLLLQRFLLVVFFTMLVSVLYFANLSYQSALGRQALAQLDLPSLPLPEALQRARNQSRQVLVDVSAIWGPTCRALDQGVLGNPDVNEYIKDHLVYSRLEFDTPEARSFLQQNKTSGFPNLWVVDGTGAAVKHIDFTLNPDQFLDQLQ